MIDSIPSNSAYQKTLQLIWQAGIDAVASDKLVRKAVVIDREHLTIAGNAIVLTGVDRVIVVGAGKAGARMASGLTDVLQPLLLQGKEVLGWINVPANCVEPNSLFTIYAGRPAEINEPHPEGVEGSKAIVELVTNTNKRDVVICLISGGGSALLPLPVDGVTIEQKSELGRFLSSSGASINELNLVRTTLSKIKGGGLLKSCNAHSVHTLIISDVMGNSLEAIASGPTVPTAVDFSQVEKVFLKYDPHQTSIDANVYQALARRRKAESEMHGEGIESMEHGDASQSISVRYFNNIIGDISTATNAAKCAAEKQGLIVESKFANESGPDVTALANEIWHWVLQNVANNDQGKARCLVSGGEPTVTLPKNSTGKGGRNQHLVLLLLKYLDECNLTDVQKARVHFLSGGTDGEDGPTNAAGAIGGFELLKHVQRLGLSLDGYISRNDSYHFFSAVGGLMVPGPTHTNVCDLRVVLVTPLQS